MPNERGPRQREQRVGRPQPGRGEVRHGDAREQHGEQSHAPDAVGDPAADGPQPAARERGERGQKARRHGGKLVLIAQQEQFSTASLYEPRVQDPGPDVLIEGYVHRPD